MSWELRYQEELRPVIEEYLKDNPSSFTSADIADNHGELSPSEIGKILRFADVDTVLKTGSNPSTWEAVYTQINSEKLVLEPIKYEEPEHEEKNPVDDAIDRLNNPNIGQIYSFFREQAEIQSQEKISDYISQYKDRV